MIHDEQPLAVGKVDVGGRSCVIAPWWHTVLVFVQLIALALIGMSRAQSSMDLPHVATYTAAAIGTWLELGAVVAGVYRRRRFFFDTLQRRAGSLWLDAWRGVALYLATMLMLAVVTVALHIARLHPGFDRQVMMAMAPKNWLELLLWFAVSVSVGFCEEHVFRGYLLQQMIAWGGKLGASPLLAASVAVVIPPYCLGVCISMRALAALYSLRF
jgi:hypothetical protein